MNYYVTVYPDMHRCTNVCACHLKNLPRDDNISMCFIANCPPEPVLNPNSSLLSSLCLLTHTVSFISLIFLFLTHVIHWVTCSIVYFITLTAVYRNETLKSLSPSYWLMGGITSKDGSSLLVYYEKAVIFNVCFRLELLGWKCEGWINMLYYIVKGQSIYPLSILLSIKQ